MVEVSVEAVERNAVVLPPVGARVGAAHIPEAKKTPVKKDLRKLSEWIKLKRELESRKSQDDGDAE